MALHLAVITLYTFCIDASDDKYYPVYGTETFDLNVDEDVTYGSGKPSVSALDENIFAIVYASSSIDRNIAYNQYINLRIFHINHTSENEPELVSTLQVNLLTNKSLHNPQIVALSDDDNQIIKKFIIVWHSDDKNGNSIYLKVIEWDYQKVEEEEENKIRIIFKNNIENKIETRVESNIETIIGSVIIKNLFDMNRFVISWIQQSTKGHIYIYDVYSIIFKNDITERCNKSIIDIESSIKEQQLSITPILLNNIERSCYYIAIWSVINNAILIDNIWHNTQTSSIYAKLIDVSSIDYADIPKFASTSFVIDGIDIYNYHTISAKDIDQNNNIHSEPDATYLFKDYFVIVYTSNVFFMDIIRVGIYKVERINSTQSKLINVFNQSINNETINGINYNHPKVDTITCYSSHIDYKQSNTKIDDEIEKNICDVSICYRYSSQNGIVSVSKTLCTFWKIRKFDDRNITMDRYYNDDINITSKNNTNYPESNSWDMIHGDFSNPMNGMSIIIDQIGNEKISHSIYGRVIKYANYTINNPPKKISEIKSPSRKNMRAMWIVVIIIIVIFFGSVFFGCYYNNNCVKQETNKRIISDEIAAVNKGIFATKSEMIKNKLSKLNPRNKKHKHHEVSGVDTDDDDIDDTEDVELGNDDDSKTAYDIAHNNMTKTKPMHQNQPIKIQKKNNKIKVKDESGSESSDEDNTQIGGGNIIARNISSSGSSNDEQDVQNNNQNNNDNNNEANVVITADLNSDDDDSSDD